MGGRGTFVGRLLSGPTACRRSWISVPTYSLCRAFTFLRLGTMSVVSPGSRSSALVVPFTVSPRSLQVSTLCGSSIPSTAVSGSLDQSVVAGGIPGVDGQCCRLQTVAVSLFVGRVGQHL